MGMEGCGGSWFVSDPKGIFAVLRRGGEDSELEQVGCEVQPAWEGKKSLIEIINLHSLPLSEPVYYEL